MLYFILAYTLTLMAAGRTPMCLVRMTALFLIIYGHAWSVTFNVHLTGVADLWAHTDIFQRKCIFQCQIYITVTDPDHQVFSRISTATKCYNNLQHHENMSVYSTPPYTPLLYSEIKVYRGIHYFLIFALKHKLWVLVRTASVKITIFTAVKYCSILQGHVCVMKRFYLS